MRAVISHWLPERIELINFFANHCSDQFDLYGGAEGPFKDSVIYKGKFKGIILLRPN